MGMEGIKDATSYESKDHLWKTFSQWRVLTLKPTARVQSNHQGIPERYMILTLASYVLALRLVGRSPIRT